MDHFIEGEELQVIGLFSVGIRVYHQGPSTVEADGCDMVAVREENIDFSGMLWLFFQFSLDFSDKDIPAVLDGVVDIVVLHGGSDKG